MTIQSNFRYPEVAASGFPMKEVAVPDLVARTRPCAPSFYQPGDLRPGRCGWWPIPRRVRHSPHLPDDGGRAAPDQRLLLLPARCSASNPAASITPAPGVLVVHPSTAADLRRRLRSQRTHLALKSLARAQDDLLLLGRGGRARDSCDHVVSCDRASASGPRRRDRRRA
jgi:hypothetical protein